MLESTPPTLVPIAVGRDMPGNALGDSSRGPGSPDAPPAADKILPPVDPRKPYLTILPPRRGVPLHLGEVWRYRDLLLTLAGRDIKLRYRQTALGAIWVILQPLIGACIFAVVFGRVAKLPSGGLPYFLFAYAGLLGWNAFSTTLSKASTCLIGNVALVSKVYFPRIILPLSIVFATLLDFAVALAMFVILMVFYKVHPTPALLLLPVWTVLLLLFGVGCGLFASALTVEYRDVQYILPVMIQFMLYASPVGYSVAAVSGHLRHLYLLNPLCGLLEAFRWSLLGVSDLSWGILAYSAAAAVLTFVAGTFAFKSMERRFADVI